MGPAQISYPSVEFKNQLRDGVAPIEACAFNAPRREFIAVDASALRVWGLTRVIKTIMPPSTVRYCTKFMLSAVPTVGRAHSTGHEIHMYIQGLVDQAEYSCRVFLRQPEASRAPFCHQQEIRTYCTTRLLYPNGENRIRQK